MFTCHITMEGKEGGKKVEMILEDKTAGAAEAKGSNSDAQASGVWPTGLMHAYTAHSLWALRRWTLAD